MFDVLCSTKFLKVADELSHALAGAVQNRGQITRNARKHFGNHLINPRWDWESRVFSGRGKFHGRRIREARGAHHQEYSLQTVSRLDLDGLLYGNEAWGAGLHGITSGRKVGEDRFAFEIRGFPNNFRALI